MDSGVLDLTFLTETERNLILQVLNRDDEIQKREDERIARLKSKAARTNNPVIQKKIKMRTGAWFFDLMQPTKAKTKSGRDTIRASIRKSNVRGFRQTRSPAPPPPAPFRVDVIVEEPAKDQYSTHTDPEPQDRTIPYAVETETQVEYVEDTPYPDYSADDRPSYGEMDDSYSSDLNRDSASVSTAHEDHMEGTLSEKTQEIDTTSEDQQTESSSSTSTAANVVITSIDSGAQKDVDETPDLPENYVYLELTPDEPEEEKSGKLKRTGSIRRKSTKRDKDRDPSTHEVNVEDHSVALKENTEHLSQEKAYPMQESVVPQDIPLDQTSSVATEVIIPANESQSNLDSEYSVAFTPHLDDDNQHHHQAVGVIDTVTLPDDVIDLTGDATTAYDDATLSPSDHTAPVEDLTSPAEDVTYHSTTTPEIIVSTTPGAQDGEHPDQDDDVSKSFRSDFELPVLETTDKDYEEDREHLEYSYDSPKVDMETLTHESGSDMDKIVEKPNTISDATLADEAIEMHSKESLKRRGVIRRKSKPPKRVTFSRESFQPLDTELVIHSRTDSTTTENFPEIPVAEKTVAGPISEEAQKLIDIDSVAEIGSAAVDSRDDEPCSTKVTDAPAVEAMLDDATGTRKIKRIGSIRRKKIQGSKAVERINESESSQEKEEVEHVAAADSLPSHDVIERNLGTNDGKDALVTEDEPSMLPQTIDQVISAPDEHPEQPISPALVQHSDTMIENALTQADDALCEDASHQDAHTEGSRRAPTIKRMGSSRRRKEKNARSVAHQDRGQLAEELEASGGPAVGDTVVVTSENAAPAIDVEVAEMQLATCPESYPSIDVTEPHRAVVESTVAELGSGAEIGAEEKRVDVTLDEPLQEIPHSDAQFSDERITETQTDTEKIRGAEIDSEAPQKRTGADESSSAMTSLSQTEVTAVVDAPFVLQPAGAEDEPNHVPNVQTGEREHEQHLPSPGEATMYSAASEALSTADGLDRDDVDSDKMTSRDSKDDGNLSNIEDAQESIGAASPLSEKKSTKIKRRGSSRRKKVVVLKSRSDSGENTDEPHKPKSAVEAAENVKEVVDEARREAAAQHAEVDRDVPSSEVDESRNDVTIDNNQNESHVLLRDGSIGYSPTETLVSSELHALPAQQGSADQTPDEDLVDAEEDAENPGLVRFQKKVKAIKRVGSSRRKRVIVAKKKSEKVEHASDEEDLVHESPLDALNKEEDCSETRSETLAADHSSFAVQLVADVIDNAQRYVANSVENVVKITITPPDDDDDDDVSTITDEVAENSNTSVTEQSTEGSDASFKEQQASVDHQNICHSARDVEVATPEEERDSDSGLQSTKEVQVRPTESLKSEEQIAFEMQSDITEPMELAADVAKQETQTEILTRTKDDADKNLCNVAEEVAAPDQGDQACVDLLPFEASNYSTEMTVTDLISAPHGEVKHPEFGEGIEDNLLAKSIVEEVLEMNKNQAYDAREAVSEVAAETSKDLVDTTSEERGEKAATDQIIDSQADASLPGIDLSQATPSHDDCTVSKESSEPCNEIEQESLFQEVQQADDTNLEATGKKIKVVKRAGSSRKKKRVVVKKQANNTEEDSSFGQPLALVPTSEDVVATTEQDTGASCDVITEQIAYDVLSKPVSIPMETSYTEVVSAEPSAARDVTPDDVGADHLTEDPMSIMNSGETVVESGDAIGSPSTDRKKRVIKRIGSSRSKKKVIVKKQHERLETFVRDSDDAEQLPTAEETIAEETSPVSETYKKMDFSATDEPISPPEVVEPTAGAHADEVTSTEDEYYPQIDRATAPSDNLSDGAHPEKSDFDPKPEILNGNDAKAPIDVTAETFAFYTGVDKHDATDAVAEAISLTEVSTDELKSKDCERINEEEFQKSEDGVSEVTNDGPAQHQSLDSVSDVVATVPHTDQIEESSKDAGSADDNVEPEAASNTLPAAHSPPEDATKFADNSLDKVDIQPASKDASHVADDKKQLTDAEELDISPGPASVKKVRVVKRAGSSRRKKKVIVQRKDDELTTTEPDGDLARRDTGADDSAEITEAKARSQHAIHEEPTPVDQNNDSTLASSLSEIFVITKQDTKTSVEDPAVAIPGDDRVAQGTEDNLLAKSIVEEVLEMNKNQAYEDREAVSEVTAETSKDLVETTSEERGEKAATDQIIDSRADASLPGIDLSQATPSHDDCTVGKESSEPCNEIEQESLFQEVQQADDTNLEATGKKIKVVKRAGSSRKKKRVVVKKQANNTEEDSSFGQPLALVPTSEDVVVTTTEQDTGASCDVITKQIAYDVLSKPVSIPMETSYTEVVSAEPSAARVVTPDDVGADHLTEDPMSIMNSGETVVESGDAIGSPSTDRKKRVIKRIGSSRSKKKVIVKKQHERLETLVRDSDDAEQLSKAEETIAEETSPVSETYKKMDFSATDEPISPPEVVEPTAGAHADEVTSKEEENYPQIDRATAPSDNLSDGAHPEKSDFDQTPEILNGNDAKAPIDVTAETFAFYTGVDKHDATDAVAEAVSLTEVSTDELKSKDCERINEEEFQKSEDGVSEVTNDGPAQHQSLDSVSDVVATVPHTDQIEESSKDAGSADDNVEPEAASNTLPAAHSPPEDATKFADGSLDKVDIQPASEDASHVADDKKQLTDVEELDISPGVKPIRKKVKVLQHTGSSKHKKKVVVIKQNANTVVVDDVQPTSKAEDAAREESPNSESQLSADPVTADQSAINDLSDPSLASTGTDENFCQVDAPAGDAVALDPLNDNIGDDSAFTQPSECLENLPAMHGKIGLSGTEESSLDDGRLTAEDVKLGNSVDLPVEHATNILPASNVAHATSEMENCTSEHVWDASIAETEEPNTVIESTEVSLECSHRDDSNKNLDEIDNVGPVPASVNDDANVVLDEGLPTVSDNKTIAMVSPLATPDIPADNAVSKGIDSEHEYSSGEYVTPTQSEMETRDDEAPKLKLQYAPPEVPEHTPEPGEDESQNGFATYRTPPAILITDVETESMEVDNEGGEKPKSIKRVGSGRKKIIKKVVKPGPAGDGDEEAQKSPKKKVVKVVKKKDVSGDAEDAGDEEGKKKKVVRVVKKKEAEKSHDEMEAEEYEENKVDEEKSKTKKKVVRVVKKKEDGEAQPKKKRVVVKKKAAE